MGRGYVIYVLMFVALAAGLWVTFSIGRGLRAPDDISGVWLVEWDGPAPVTSDQPSGRMDVRQSGRFLTVTFDDQLSLSMKINEGAALGNESDERLAVMSGDGWTLALTSPDDAKSSRIELSGPSRHSGTARRESEAIKADDHAVEAPAAPQQPGGAEALHARG